MMPLAWAAAKPRAICTAVSTAFRTGKAPAFSRSRSDSPTSNSVTTKVWPPSEPVS